MDLNQNRLLCICTCQFCESNIIASKSRPLTWWVLSELLSAGRHINIFAGIFASYFNACVSAFKKKNTLIKICEILFEKLTEWNRSRSFWDNWGKHSQTHRHNDADENNTCPKTKFLGQVIRTQSCPFFSVPLYFPMMMQERHTRRRQLATKGRSFL